MQSTERKIGNELKMRINYLKVPHLKKRDVRIILWYGWARCGQYVNTRVALKNGKSSFQSFVGRVFRFFLIDVSRLFPWKRWRTLRIKSISFIRLSVLPIKCSRKISWNYENFTDKYGIWKRWMRGTFFFKTTTGVDIRGDRRAFDKRTSYFHRFCLFQLSVNLTGNL